MVGYDVKQCEALPQKFTCPLCHLLMRDPIQTYRGLLACKECYESATSDDICPIDAENGTEFFNDKCLKNQIMLSKCACINKDFGCPWEGVIGGFEDHSTCCEYVQVKCPFCENEVNRLRSSLHLDECPRLPEGRKCIYEGCPFKPLNLEDFNHHLKESFVRHEMLRADSMRNKEIQFNEFMNNASLYIMGVEDKVKENGNRIHQLREQVNTMDQDVSDLQVRQQLVNTSYYGEMMWKIDNVSHHINCNENMLSRLHKGMEVMDQKVSALDLRQQLFEHTSYNGKLLWKIDNVSYRLNQAIIGKEIGIHSNPAFTSKPGYKFCARLYLNGDGVGRGTHVSLFFVLMKSEYDNVLKWPFSKKVTMRLLNQDQPLGDVVECFDADINCSSFIQPMKNMSTACGCAMFITKDTLLNKGFVKEDTMFLELTVSDKL